jgi:hypothetical protein
MFGVHLTTIYRLIPDKYKQHPVHTRKSEVMTLYSLGLSPAETSRDVRGIAIETRKSTPGRPRQETFAVRDNRPPENCIKTSSSPLSLKSSQLRKVKPNQESFNDRSQGHENRRFNIFESEFPWKRCASLCLPVTREAAGSSPVAPTVGVDLYLSDTCQGRYPPLDFRRRTPARCPEAPSAPGLLTEAPIRGM